MNLARYVFTSSLLLAGCPPEEVELVHFGSDADAEINDAGDVTAEPVPSMDAGHGTSESDARVRPPFFDFDAGAPRSCSSNAECASREYCYMTSCTQKRGTCAPRPSNCGANFDQGICGCDGLHYFNDCLRLKSGVNADPTCAREQPCSSTSPCFDPRAVCSNIYRDRSLCRQGPAERECWIVPALCAPNTLGGDQYVSCDAPSSGGPEACVSYCEALQSEAPHAQASRCSPPRSGPTGTNFM